LELAMLRFTASVATLALVVVACHSARPATRRSGTDSASTPATIVGTVRDADTGAPLAGISVWLGRTAFATRTDSVGHYVLHDMPPARYSVVAAHARYITEEVQRMIVAGRVDTLDFRLRLNQRPVPDADRAASRPRNRSPR
jgi:carboxypeptidase family protein